jgi:hypothetical protein
MYGFGELAMNRKSFFVTVFSSLVLIGCGGGASPLKGGSQVSSVGEMQVAFSGNARPQVQTLESGISVASMAGASFSNLTFNPAQTLQNSTIGYLSPALALHTYQNGLDQIIDSGIFTDALGGCLSRDGHLYATTVHEDLTGHIDKSFYDGTGSTSILSTPSEATIFNNVAVSPDSSHIAYDEAAPYALGGLHSARNTGASPLLLDAAGGQPAISPNNATVAFVKTVGSYTQIFTIPIGGGAETQISSDSNNHYYPNWSPGGDIIICDTDTGASRYISTYSSGGGSIGSLSLSGYAYESHACPSPDGKYLLCQLGTVYGSGATVAVINSDGVVQTISTSGQMPFWSPFFASRTWVGSGSWMFPNAAGFLLAEYQSGFDSLLAFTATTPSSATITETGQSVSGSSGPPIYDVHADTVTSIKYVNDYNSTPITVTPNTSDALVTLDGTTGQINAVAPFVATRGQALHTPKSLTYTAHFTAVYDKHGKNLAPNGASQLVLDPKTCAIVSMK